MKHPFFDFKTFISIKLHFVSIKIYGLNQPPLVPIRVNNYFLLFARGVYDINKKLFELNTNVKIQEPVRHAPSFRYKNYMKWHKINKFNVWKYAVLTDWIVIQYIVDQHNKKPYHWIVSKIIYNLNICIKTKPVTVCADAAVYVNSSLCMQWYRHFIWRDGANMKSLLSFSYLCMSCFYHDMC